VVVEVCSGIVDVYLHVDGIRYRQATHTKNRRRAELIEKHFKDELNLKRHKIAQFNPDMTFGDLAIQFIANSKKGNHNLLRLPLLLPHFGDLPVSRINKGLAREYRQARQKVKRVSDATTNRDLSVLRHVLYWGATRGH
jgi:hypothetical protein